MQITRSVTYRHAFLFFGSMLALPATSALADITTLTVSDGTQNTSSQPTSLPIAVTRDGDLGYDAILQYHTVDGTAHAGVDYTGSTGVLRMPAGATSGTIEIPIASINGTTDKTFTVVVDGATGIGNDAAFSAQQTFATGDRAYGVTFADLNGDGKPDLIVTNDQSATISVLINTTAPGDTTPSYAAQQTFTVGTTPYAVIATDINGDGVPDLVVVNNGDATVSVLLNTTAAGAASVSFAAQETFAVGNNPWSVVAADINNDGRPDLCVADWADNKVSVLLNTTPVGSSTASFNTQATFSSGSGPRSIAAADINGDGKLDLITAGQFQSGVSVLINTTAPGAATPTFAGAQNFATGNTSIWVSAADIDGDGRPDLLVANYGSGTVSLLLNKTKRGVATASFATQKSVSVGGSPEQVSAADLNGDGKLDLVVENGTGVLTLGNLTPAGSSVLSFGAPQSFATGAGPLAVAIGDVDTNGMPDLAVTNVSDDTVSVLLNTTAALSPATFAAQQPFATGGLPVSVTAGDFNGDGKPDLAVADLGGSQMSVVLNTTAQGATPSFGASASFPVGSGPRASAAADFNGDGKLDLAAVNENDNTVSVLLNTTAVGAATASFATHQDFPTGSFPFSVAAADLDGDGRPDLVVANAHDSTISVLRNVTPPGATSASFAVQQTFSGGGNAQTVRIVDVNGDGKPDIVISNFNPFVSVLINITAPGDAPNFAPVQTFSVGTADGDADAADINGDGLPDLIVTGLLDNNVYVLLNTSAPGSTSMSFAAPQTLAVGGRPDAVTVKDLDGDGKPDIIVANQNDSTVTVLLNATPPGASTIAFSSATLTSDAAPAGVTAVDLNGDGIPDLATGNLSSGDVSVFLNTRYRALISGSPATGTIVHDLIFANGFE